MESLTGYDTSFLEKQIQIQKKELPQTQKLPALQLFLQRQLSLSLAMESGTTLPCVYKVYENGNSFSTGMFCRYSKQQYHVADETWRPQISRIKIDELNMYIGKTIFLTSDVMAFDAIDALKNIQGVENKKRVIRTAVFQSDSFYRSKKLAISSIQENVVK